MIGFFRLSTVFLITVLSLGSFVWAAEKNIEQKIDDSININKASSEEIAKKLHGVGIRKARRIVKHREKYGLFKKPEDIIKVKGIGRLLFKRNRKVIEI